jgi:hypothetical protein
MQPTGKPVSKIKIALLWLFLIGNLVFWCGFWIWWQRRQAPVAEPPPDTDVFRVIFMTIFGAIFLAAGAGAYAAVIFSNCFTSDFSRPVWDHTKGKLYVANIIVPLLPALGVGLALSGPFTPMLHSLGLDGTLAGLLPVFFMIAVLQVAQVFIMIWAPLERRLITKRLAALNIRPDQLQNAILIGLSNPLRSSLKKLGTVEEDMGALWINSGPLTYYGDKERFSISRDQLIQIERKADAASMTMLLGIAHIVLHVRSGDGSQRQIRLHTEGLWTMTRKRKAMDELAERLAQWHAAPSPAPPPIPA